jgi:hypothetical protein
VTDPPLKPSSSDRLSRTAGSPRTTMHKLGTRSFMQVDEFGIRDASNNHELLVLRWRIFDTALTNVAAQFTMAVTRVRCRWKVWMPRLMSMLGHSFGSKEKRDGEPNSFCQDVEDQTVYS